MYHKSSSGFQGWSLYMLNEWRQWLTILKQVYRQVKVKREARLVGVSLPHQPAQVRLLLFLCVYWSFTKYLHDKRNFNDLKNNGKSLEFRVSNMIWYRKHYPGTWETWNWSKLHDQWVEWILTSPFTALGLGFLMVKGGDYSGWSIIFSFNILNDCVVFKPCMGLRWILWLCWNWKKKGAYKQYVYRLLVAWVLLMLQKSLFYSCFRMSFLPYL